MFLSFIFSRFYLNIVIFFLSRVIKPQYPLEIYFFIIQDLQHEKDVIFFIVIIYLFYYRSCPESRASWFKILFQILLPLVKQPCNPGDSLPCGFMMSSSYSIIYIFFVSLSYIYFLLSQSYFLLFQKLILWAVTS